MNESSDAFMNMPSSAIKKHIQEFRLMLQANRRNHGKLLARGAFLYGLRDVLDIRLKKGWDYIEEHPDSVIAADHWFVLLDCYEQINELLDEAKGCIDRKVAVQVIFDAYEEKHVNAGLRQGAFGFPHGPAK